MMVTLEDRGFTETGLRNLIDFYMRYIDVTEEDGVNFNEAEFLAFVNDNFDTFVFQFEDFVDEANEGSISDTYPRGIMRDILASMSGARFWPTYSSDDDFILKASTLLQKFCMKFYN